MFGRKRTLSSWSLVVETRDKGPEVVINTASLGVRGSRAWPWRACVGVRFQELKMPRTCSCPDI